MLSARLLNPAVRFTNGCVATGIMTTPRVAITPVSDLSPEVAEKLRGMTEREFGTDPMIYAEPQWYVLGFLEGELVSRVGILRRTVSVGEKPLHIGGVCTIVTEPEYRGRGIASSLVGNAVMFLRDQLQLDFGLLTCKPRLEGLYARLGWRTVEGPTVFDQPSGMRSCGGLTMVIECGGRPWPKGKIDLCGLPW